MFHAINTKLHLTVSATRPEVIVRAAILCRAAGLEFPTPQIIKWIERNTADYDNSTEYWQPYVALDDGTVLVATWARGGYGYIKATKVDAPAIESHDPAVWHTNLRQEWQDYPKDKYVGFMFDVMDEHTNPNDGYWGPRIQEFHDSVRRAIDSGKLITDAAKARRRLARVPIRVGDAT